MSNTTSESESSKLVQNCNANEYVTTFSQSAERSRNCCPLCGSVRIARRIRKGGYTCSNCLKVFYTPSSKTVLVGGNHTGRLPVALFSRGMQAWASTATTNTNFARTAGKHSYLSLVLLFSANASAPAAPSMNAPGSKKKTPSSKITPRSAQHRRRFKCLPGFQLLSQCSAVSSSAY